MESTELATRYPLPSEPTLCSPGQTPHIVRRHWRFGQVDPATDAWPRRSRGRITAWCMACGELLEVQEEGTGRVLSSGLPHGRRPEESCGAGGSVRPPAELRHLASGTSVFVTVLRDVLEVVESANLDAYGELRDTLVDALRADQPGTPARLAQVVEQCAAGD